MDVKELKFLLKLLGKQLYRASISKIKPNDKTSAAERDRICRQLRDRKLVDCTEEIVKIKLTPSGQALLKLDSTSVPIDDAERKILQACQKGAIARSEIKFKSATTRDKLIEKLTDHQEVIAEVTKTLDLVAKDGNTRTILLDGERGSGKSYLLGRLKKKLNSKAVFAYVEPCPSNDHVWRHTLRYTVDSLMYKPEGEKESQLLLWLKSLSAFKDKGLLKKLLGEKKQFIHNLQTTYPAGVYQARQFFGVLYELTQPDKYTIACDWLRGEYLDQEDLKTLGVNFVIDSEEAARGILGNFGRIADATKPIVLCFDQVELAPKLADGRHDISAVFHVNTACHNNALRNFLVVISIVTDYWREYKKQFPHLTCRESKTV